MKILCVVFLFRATLQGSASFVFDGQQISGAEDKDTWPSARRISLDSEPIFPGAAKGQCSAQRAARDLLTSSAQLVLYGCTNCSEQRRLLSSRLLVCVFTIFICATFELVFTAKSLSAAGENNYKSCAHPQLMPCVQLISRRLQRAAKKVQHLLEVIARGAFLTVFDLWKQMRYNVFLLCRRTYRT